MKMMKKFYFILDLLILKFCKQPLIFCFAVVGENNRAVLSLFQEMGLTLMRFEAKFDNK